MDLICYGCGGSFTPSAAEHERLDAGLLHGVQSLQTRCARCGELTAIKIRLVNPPDETWACPGRGCSGWVMDVEGTHACGECGRAWNMEQLGDGSRARAQDSQSRAAPRRRRRRSPSTEGGHRDTDVVVWRRFASAGPAYSLPIERGTAEVGERTVYAGLYRLSDFGSLGEFRLYQHYTASVQQDLLRSGELLMEYFEPESDAVGLARAARQLSASSHADGPDEVTAALDSLRLPPDIERLVASWGVDACVHNVTSTEFELVGRGPRGYITLFAVQT